MRSSTLIAAALLLAGTAFGEGAVTIVGEGNGPVTIVEKDGTVRTVKLPNGSALKAQGKAHAEAKAAREKQEAEILQQQEEAKKMAEKAAEAERKKAEEAKAKAAAQQAKALKEQQAAQKKELAHYNDKDYTYGPGSAKKVDRTGVVVGEKKREERGVANSEDDSTAPKVTVGGEARVRYNQYSR